MITKFKIWENMELGYDVLINYLNCFLVEDDKSYWKVYFFEDIDRDDNGLYNIKGTIYMIYKKIENLENKWFEWKKVKYKKIKNLIIDNYIPTDELAKQFPEVMKRLYKYVTFELEHREKLFQSGHTYISHEWEEQHKWVEKLRLIKTQLDSIE